MIPSAPDKWLAEPGPCPGFAAGARACEGVCANFERHSQLSPPPELA